MRKYNIEVNWHGMYGSDGWQVVTDEPVEAESMVDLDTNLDEEWIRGCMSVTTLEGVEEVPGAEYRIVELEE